MKLSQRIRLLLQAAANDLFGEDQAPEVRQTLNGETWRGLFFRAARLHGI